MPQMRQPQSDKESLDKLLGEGRRCQLAEYTCFSTFNQNNTKNALYTLII